MPSPLAESSPRAFESDPDNAAYQTRSVSGKWCSPSRPRKYRRDQCYRRFPRQQNSHHRVQLGRTLRNRLYLFGLDLNGQPIIRRGHGWAASHYNVTLFVRTGDVTAHTSPRRIQDANPKSFKILCQVFYLTVTIRLRARSPSAMYSNGTDRALFRRPRLDTLPNSQS